MKELLEIVCPTRRRSLTGLIVLGFTCPGVAVRAQETEAEPVVESESEVEEAITADDIEVEEVDYRNFVDFGVGGAFVDGDKAAMQRRTGLPAGAFGGVENFHYERDIGESALFQLDGRAIFGNDDYRVRLELSEMDKGFVRAGYTQYRTYSDGSGGYFPGAANQSWFDLYDDQLYVNRREAWFEAGLQLPEYPQFTIRYSHSERDGNKDATHWGDTTTLVPAPYGPTRKIVPAFYDLDERKDAIRADAKYTVGLTGLGLGFRYENRSVDNTLNLRRNPGEVNDRRATQRNGDDSDLFNVNAFTDTRFNEHFWLTVGYAFTDLDTEFSGYRLYGTTYDPDVGQRLPSPDTYQDLSGGSRLNQHVANVNFRYSPNALWSLVPSVRVLSQDMNGSSGYGQPGDPFTPNAYSVRTERGLLDVSPQFDVRFTGVTNWTFYAQGRWLVSQGNLVEDWNNVSSSGNVLNRDTDDERFSQKYSVGARWYPLRRLHLGAEYYHKKQNNDYTHLQDSTPNASGFNRYPAFLTAQRYDLDDVNFRLTWRLLRNMTFVGQYDYQFSTIDSQGDGLAQIESAEMESHIWGGSLNWTPWSRLFLYTSLNYVLDRAETPSGDITPSTPDSRNDYWTANVGGSYVLNEKTDLEARYFYYRADNYNDTSAYGQPYGADGEEHGVMAGVVRRVSARMRVKVNYGFVANRDNTAGGFNDFDSHLVTAGMQYRF